MSGIVLTRVREGFYLDSVALMRISQQVSAEPGVVEAAFLIGTPSNLELLAEAGLLGETAVQPTMGDLVLSVRAKDGTAAEAALTKAERLLERPRFEGGSEPGGWEPATLRGALQALPEANLALISVPGEFAAAEARKALQAGLHVMLFSDNVPVEEELLLKEEARGKGLLMMGPDCGTAILNGVPLGFANAVPEGPIGIIAASGTGCQEVASLIARAGGGISHAIGTGGRDLSAPVGGLTTLMAIGLLEEDPKTEHVILISKPPDASVLRKVLERVGESPKPFTLCFIGTEPQVVPSNATLAPTLAKAANAALGRPAGPFVSIEKLAEGHKGGSGRIAGLFAGGTLCAEAQVVLLGRKFEVASNMPVPGALPLAEATPNAHRLIDLGADEFTRGRPHPMIDPTFRDEQLRKILQDAEVSVVLLDIVLGFGSHPDPAGSVVAALGEAGRKRIPVVTSVCGTDGDPQNYSAQVKKLREADVLVAPSNMLAAELAARLVAPKSGQRKVVSHHA